MRNENQYVAYVSQIKEFVRIGFCRERYMYTTRYSAHRTYGVREKTIALKLCPNQASAKEIAHSWRRLAKHAIRHLYYPTDGLAEAIKGYKPKPRAKTLVRRAWAATLCTSKELVLDARHAMAGKGHWQFYPPLRREFRLRLRGLYQKYKIEWDPQGHVKKFFRMCAAGLNRSPYPHSPTPTDPDMRRKGRRRDPISPAAAYRQVLQTALAELAESFPGDWVLSPDASV